MDYFRGTSSIICKGCSRSIDGAYITVEGDKTFHHRCFRCSGCNESIDGRFVPKDGEFYHPQCHEALFAMRCGLCNDALSGKQFLRHSFFREKPGYCAHHEGVAKCCFSCNQKESSRDPFATLPDGRSVCMDCISTAIFDSSDAQAIYIEVVDFLERRLNFRIPAEMREAPVLAVDLSSLNDQKKLASYDCSTGAHKGVDASIVRGLTMSTVSQTTPIRYVGPGSIAWIPNGSSGSRAEFITSQQQLFRHQSSPGTVTTRQVTAVLVLCGLPRHLTASILAHEAMHVWCKLSVDVPLDLPAVVEEGICQFVSWKYLDYIHDNSTAHLASKKTWETRLTEYYKYLIEMDPSSTYGDGFRRAAECSSAIGLEELLFFIKESKSFPTV